MPRGRLPTSAPHCIRRGLADRTQLFAVTLQRAYRPRLPDGSRPRQRTLAIATHLCHACAKQLTGHRRAKSVAEVDLARP